MGVLTVKNRLVRSATYEGMCDKEGFPTADYISLYKTLAAKGCGTAITGCSYICQQGKTIHSRQARIDCDDMIAAFKPVTDAVHEYDGRIIMQLAHAGRQTMSRATGEPVVSLATEPSRYFGETPQHLTAGAIRRIAKDFIVAAKRAELAGFDGVQLHAAHGYLLHEFLIPAINLRNDEYGYDPSTGIGSFIFKEIIDGIRANCSKKFAILVKISGAVDNVPFSVDYFMRILRFFNMKRIDAIEISYGTMEYPLNVFRGNSLPLNTILDHDPVYREKKFFKRLFWKLFVAPILAINVRRFSPAYNLPFAEYAKHHTSVPIISVGGFRSGEEIRNSLKADMTDFVAMSRPFIAEPDLAEKLKDYLMYHSRCINCNRCAATTGSDLPTLCRRKRKQQY